jgi:hypothetical protein
VKYRVWCRVKYRVKYRVRCRVKYGVKYRVRYRDACVLQVA